MNPKISIIIPTYNDGLGRLKITVASVLNQTFRNIEVIVSDDGSAHPFSGLDKKLDDHRIRWLKNEHRGVAHTRNAGLKAAKGKYVAFLDTGDWWDAEKLEQQLLLFNKNPDLALVYTSVKTHDSFGRVGKLDAKRRGYIYRDLLIGQPIVGSCSSVLIPKTILDQIGGFYTDQDIPEDQELWLRISRLGEIDFVKEYLVHLEIGLMSRSANPVKKMKPYQHFLEIYSKELRQENLEAIAWANYYVAIADKFFSKGEFLNGMQQLLQSFRKTITKSALIRLIAGFFSLLGPKAYSFTKHVYRNKRISG